MAPSATLTTTRAARHHRTQLDDITPNNKAVPALILSSSSSSSSTPSPHLTPSIAAAAASSFATQSTTSSASSAPTPADLCKVAYFNDLPVGAVVCRKVVAEPAASKPAKKGAAAAATADAGSATVWVEGVGVLEKYRRLGIATQLLEHVVSVCTAEVGGKRPAVKAILAELPAGDDAAVSLFRDKLGFVAASTVAAAGSSGREGFVVYEKAL
ncbi:hypothetical protein DFJ73DRAFT_781118 [Zopfochytrium polystomum]|nr:hypothetical protein DFJ73DRAFT_781118 [Zopfochytrium polystomum]